MQPIIAYFRVMIHPGAALLRFALRTTAAGVLTLYLAFIFELDQPKWSLMAVIIISQPQAGMTLARSFGQVSGTVFGAVVAVLIMMAFPQAPLLFLLTLGLWLAICTAAGTLLRHTRSQAIVLSGYTAVVVAMLSIPDQGNTSILAITRVTETLLAVASVCMVTLLTSGPESVLADYLGRIDKLLKLLAIHAASVIRGGEPEEAFQTREKHVLREVSALEAIRQYLSFDSPRLRNNHGLLTVLGNQLLLLTSNLTVLHHHHELLRARADEPSPLALQHLRADALALLEQLALQGHALPSGPRRRFADVQRRFDDLVGQAEHQSDTLPLTVHSLAWALRWEQAQMLQRLQAILELSEAISQGRAASSIHGEGRTHSLHLDWPLATMNGIRAFVALMAVGWLWIETGWDGARSSLVLVGILCSLMATLPRPLLAVQNYLRGQIVALLVCAVYVFGLLPLVGDFEWLALLLIPLLYTVAVGLADPTTAGIAMGLGLTSLLMIGPQNIGAWQNSADQWFEFAGAYLMGGVLSMFCYRLIFPFDPVRRIRRLFNDSCEQLADLQEVPATDHQQFVFETRLVDRLIQMLALLPEVDADRASIRRFETTLACLPVGVAMLHLGRQDLDRPWLLPAPHLDMRHLLKRIGDYVAGRDAVELADLLAQLRAVAHLLDWPQNGQATLACEHMGALLHMRVSLLVIGDFLERLEATRQFIDTGDSVRAQ